MQWVFARATRIRLPALDPDEKDPHDAQDQHNKDKIAAQVVAFEHKLQDTLLWQLSV